MDKEKAEILLAFSAWLDREMDGYLLVTTRDGKSSLISNGDNKQIKAALSTAISKYPHIKALISESLHIADYLNNTKTLN